MSASNVVAQHVESHGVDTYSAKEMAFNIFGLMHPLLFSITQVKPIWADLNGAVDCLARSTPIVAFAKPSLAKTTRAQMVQMQRLSSRTCQLIPPSFSGGSV